MSAFCDKLFLTTSATTLVSGLCPNDLDAILDESVVRGPFETGHFAMIQAGNPYSDMNFRPTSPDGTDTAIVKAAFARIDVVAFAAATAIIFGLVLAGSTAVLLLQGAAPGRAIGPHLALLAQFLPGFSISWPGVLIGAGYGALIGSVIGIWMGVFWNIVHHVYLLVLGGRDAIGAMEI